VVYDRLHTREISAYGGLVERMPVYAACFMVFALANMGLPGTSGFVGEFLTMLGTFQVNTWVVIFAATGMILSAAYMLYLYGRVIFGALVKPALKVMQDLSAREIAILAPLVAFTIILGIFPRIITDETSVSVANLVAQHRVGLASETGGRLAFFPRARAGEGNREAVEGETRSVGMPPPHLRRTSPTLRAEEENGARALAMELAP
jgi:NADH-quinone oxidoreductase subunit M